MKALDDSCVMCGAPHVPEGAMVCPACRDKYKGLAAEYNTNADRIRHMDTLELANEIWACRVFAGFHDLYEWLKREV